MKKIISFVLIFMMVLSIPAYAKENDVNEKYSLKIIEESQVPEGVVPVEVESMEELEILLKSIDTQVNELNNTTNTIMLRKEDTKENSLDEKSIKTFAGSRSGYTAPVTFSKDYNVSLGGVITLYGQATVTTWGSFANIDSFDRAWTRFSGFTYGFDWNPSMTWGSVAPNGQSCKAKTSGTLDFYVAQGGKTALFKRAVDIEVKYAVSPY